MKPIVAAVDGSQQANQAVAWAADHAMRSARPLHLVHCQSGDSDEGDRLLVAAAALAGRDRPGLVVTTELSADPPMMALTARADRAAEIVLGHGPTGRRLAGMIPCPVVVVAAGATERGTVVVAIDGYDVCAPALNFACRNAEVRGSRLLAVEVRMVPAKLRAPALAPLTARVVADATGQLSGIVAPWRAEFPGLEVAERIVLGDPATTLVALSDQADLIVLGSRGLNRLQSALHGSVSRRVLRRARCPIAVVPRAREYDGTCPCVAEGR